MTHAPRNESGFALLVMLGIIGAGSVGLLLAVQAIVPGLADRDELARANLDLAADAAQVAYRRDGAFPADLDGLAAAGGLDAAGLWRRDPYGAGEELDYGIAGSGLRVRSRGVDGQLGSSDDLEREVATETQLRVRQRLRLRMLRAVLLRSPYRHAVSMSASEEVQMRDAMRGYARARRHFLTADPAARVTLTNDMATARSTIDGLVALHAMPALPSAVTGVGGLMGQLAMPDARAVDGRGAALVIDDVLGWVAIGSDGTGGTDDDM